MDWLDLITNEVDRDTMRINATITRRSEHSAHGPRETLTSLAPYHKKTKSSSAVGGGGVKD